MNLAGLAKAFGDTLHRHPTLAEIIRTYFGVEDPASPAYKLAYVIDFQTNFRIYLKKK